METLYALAGRAVVILLVLLTPLCLFLLMVWRLNRRRPGVAAEPTTPAADEAVVPAPPSATRATHPDKLN